jgi:glycosyltransferase involved in cell wall biosynthesis
MPDTALAIFDPTITNTSPAGSCLFKIARAAVSSYPLHLFTEQTDLEADDRILIHRMPVPRKPVFVQNIAFTLLALLFRKPRALRISTQGGYPFCDISYAHCCHKLFLTSYRHHITGDLFTRVARLLNHAWCALMEAVAFRHARTIVVPSQGLAQELTAAYGDAVASKLRVIPNPVDCPAFSNSGATLPDHLFTFCFCALGNFEWKGLPLILQALAGMKSARLLVIGGTHADIERYRHITHLATFVGMQSDIRPYLWTCNAFVFPSVYETFPLVCLQAAAAGLPLIATNLYGLEELLQPEISGWRVERTVESIRQAMHMAMADPKRTATMGRAAQSLAQQYDEPAFQQRWLQLLRELLV